MRTPFPTTRRAPLLAAIAALAYALEGAIVLRRPQPDHHWNGWGYAVEIAFGVALIATIPILPLLAARSSRTAQIAIGVAQLGLTAMLVAAAASIAADGDVLGPAFFFGLLAALGGILVATVAAARSRLESWWLAPVVLAGLVAGMALGNHGGGILIGISWAVVAIALRGSRAHVVPVAATA
jgi:hypothetical protein